MKKIEIKNSKKYKKIEVDITQILKQSNIIYNYINLQSGPIIIKGLSL